MTKIAKILALTLFALSASLQIAFGCACCIDHGERYTRQVELSDWLKEEMSLIKFSNEAHLFSTACGLECATGIANPQGQYAVSMSRSNDDWTITFTSPETDESSLRFSLPKTAEQFVVETKPDVSKPPGRAYKELRIPVLAQGDGMFTAGLATKTEAQLIFQGVGNYCPSVTDFETWRFEVDGEKAKFQLFGDVIAQ